MHSPEYDARLHAILTRGDWEALRDFTRAENEIPDDVYERDQHFWEVLLHKLTCNRLDTAAQHDRSRAWLSKEGYSTDLGGF